MHLQLRLKKLDTINCDLLADISRNQVDIITAFHEIRVDAVGTLVRQVQRHSDILAVSLLVGYQIEEQLVKICDMTFCLCVTIFSAIAGVSLNGFSLCKDIDSILHATY